MITAGVSRVASGLLCVHAIAITPAGSMKLVRSFISIDCGLPCVTVKSAPAIIVSGPAQRSLTLWPARSPSRLATLYIESSDSFVASAAVSIVTGWSEPVPGRELHPLKPSAFSRRTVTSAKRRREGRAWASRVLQFSRVRIGELIAHFVNDLLSDLILHDVGVG
jgi:hypothetical protein